MAAFAALAHAPLLRVQGSAASSLVIAAVGGLMPQLVKAGLRNGTAAQFVFALVGAIALGAAAFVNHRTLTRSTSSSSAYRPPPPPFGLPRTLAADSRYVLPSALSTSASAIIMVIGSTGEAENPAFS